VTAGYHALQENRAFVDFSHRGRIQASGEDRARLLHALTTNHVQQMKAGDRIYCFFLTAQGRILSDAILVCEQDRFLIDVEPEVRETVWKHIDHYIIADDVALEDVTESSFSLGVGSNRIYGNLAQKEQAKEEAVGLGLVEATTEDWRTFRIEHFQPRYGEDITSSTLPQETGIKEALHFQKGCYLGQEIVERIRSRGHVNKMLAGLSIQSDRVPVVGTKVRFEGAEAGEITSAVGSPIFGDIRAIAMLRVQAAQPGSTVDVDGSAAQVHAVHSAAPAAR
jgi:tRNA-modifying protein YgfZ